MALKVEMVTFDCGDPAKLAGWWAEQFGGTTQELLPGEFIAVTRPEGPRLGFQKVPDPTPGKNRVHLDFSVPDVDAEVSRLTAAGATEVGGRKISDNSAGWYWPTPKATCSAWRVNNRLNGCASGPIVSL
jgi:predicted enzyme related to lactoylglutathione lyase